MVSKVISRWWTKRWDWHDPPVKTELSSRSQRDFEVEFFEGIIRRRYDYWEILSVLGNHYTAAKAYRKGLKIDERLAILRPNDPVVFYNLAFSSAQRD